MPSFSNIIALGVIILVALAGFFTYQAGQRSKENEMAAIQVANDRAVAAAEKDLREDLSSAIIEKQRLEDELEKLIKAADADPGADACGMSVDGVRRHNAVK